MGFMSASNVDLFARRVHNIIPLDCQQLLPNLRDHFEVACVLLRKLRNNEAMHVYRSWLNGWATSARMHGAQISGCLFGCEGMECKDALSHYVQCPVLAGILLEFECSDPGNRGLPFLQPDSVTTPQQVLLWRWQICNPSIRGLIRLASICKSYHAVMPP